jgi:hypothetical protein
MTIIAMNSFYLKMAEETLLTAAAQGKPQGIRDYKTRIHP